MLPANPGAFTIAAGFPLARRLSLLLVPPLYLFFPMGARRLWQPPMHSLQPNADPNGLPVDKVTPDSRSLPLWLLSPYSGHMQEISQQQCRCVASASVHDKEDSAISQAADAKGLSLVSAPLTIAPLTCLVLMQEGEPWDVEITARFVAFASIGWAMHLSAIAFSVLEW